MAVSKHIKGALAIEAPLDAKFYASPSRNAIVREAHAVTETELSAKKIEREDRVSVFKSMPYIHFWPV